MHNIIKNNNTRLSDTLWRANCAPRDRRPYCCITLCYVAGDIFHDGGRMSRTRVLFANAKCVFGFLENVGECGLVLWVIGVVVFMSLMSV